MFFWGWWAFQMSTCISFVLANFKKECSRLQTSIISTFSKLAKFQILGNFNEICCTIMVKEYPNFKKKQLQISLKNTRRMIFGFAAAKGCLFVMKENQFLVSIEIVPQQFIPWLTQLLPAQYKGDVLNRLGVRVEFRIIHQWVTGSSLFEFT